MSVFFTGEVMNRVLLFSSRRPLWQRHGCLVTASATSVPKHRPPLFLIREQSRAHFSWSSVHPVRFYTEKKPSPGPGVQSEVTESGQRVSPFQDHLQRCISPSDVLDLTLTYSPTIGQVVSCLTHMWTTTKKMSDDQRKYELQLLHEHPGLEGLLKKAMRSVGHMQPEALAYSLLSMVKLGVSQDSRVVQTFLRACQVKISDFNEKGLSILATCLRHMDDSPNVAALKDGMRFVIELSLPEIKNVMRLQTLMRLLGKDTPKELKRKFERKALSMSDQFSNPNAQFMIFAMAEMGCFSKPLLDTCMKKITENLHTIPFNRMIQLLHACLQMHYRDIEMLTAMSEYVTSTVDIWTNKQLLIFLAVFGDLKFCPDTLMEVYAEKVLADPDALTLKDVLCVIKVYSGFNFDLRHQRLPFVDSLSLVLTSYLPQIPPFLLLKAVYCFCLLGHFPVAPLEQLLQTASLQEIQTSKFPKSCEKMLQTVDLCLRLDRPALPRPLAVPPSVLGDAELSQWTANPELKQGLQRVLEDQAQAELQEMVVVEKFYLLDAVITKPLPRQTSVPPHSQRLAVLLITRSSLCYGTSRPRGSLAMKLRHLELLGYEPLLLLEDELLSLPEEEQIDFLRERIFPAEGGSQTLSHETELQAET